MRQRILLFLLFCVVSVTSNSQELLIKKFELISKDQTAVENPRKDANGVAGGLVRVQIKMDGLKFVGNKLGEVDFNEKEYLLYLAAGTNRLTIKHDDYATITLLLENLCGQRIESGKTYRLVLKASDEPGEFNDKKYGTLNLEVLPRDAFVMVDNKKQEKQGNGVYSLELPHGVHYYSVNTKGYKIDHLVADISKEPLNHRVDLTEYFAPLSVTCKDADAEIIVNRESVGVGSWSDTVPPIKYTIEVQKKDYYPLTKKIELKERQGQTVEFDALQPMVGSMHIDSNPQGATVYIDGDSVGVTPFTRNELRVGSYDVEIKMKDYVDWKEAVLVSDGRQASRWAKLAHVTGSVRVDYKPDGALVRLDEDSVGVTPLTLEKIITGSHRVEISKEGYITKNEGIEVLTDQETLLQGRLIQDFVGDGATFDIRGVVREVIYRYSVGDEPHTERYTFDNQTRLIARENENGEPIYEFKSDPFSNRIERISSHILDHPYAGGTYTYNTEGRVLQQESTTGIFCFKGGEGISYQLSYNYGADGYVPFAGLTTIVTDPTDAGIPPKTYNTMLNFENVSLDDHGNWTQRKVTGEMMKAVKKKVYKKGKGNVNVTSFERVPVSLIEEREITYYDE